MTRATLLLLVAACSSSRPRPAEPPPPVVEEPQDAEPAVQRTLTDREREILAPLFLASLDLDVIHVVQDKYVPFQGDDTYMTPENEMFAPGDLYLPDFAAPDIEPYVASTLVHEMTHAWQHQSGLDLVAAGAITFAATGGDYQKAYAYTLDPKKDLIEYNVEQQASIVEDWYLLTVRRVAPYSLVQDWTQPVDWVQMEQDFRAVLAKFFADPLYARQLTPDELLRRHATAVRAP